MARLGTKEDCGEGIALVILGCETVTEPAMVTKVVTISRFGLPCSEVNFLDT
jgi:hypothetical protein